MSPSGVSPKFSAAELVVGSLGGEFEEMLSAVEQIIAQANKIIL